MRLSYSRPNFFLVFLFFCSYRSSSCSLYTTPFGDLPWRGSSGRARSGRDRCDEKGGGATSASGADVSADMPGSVPVPVQVPVPVPVQGYSKYIRPGVDMDTPVGLRLPYCLCSLPNEYRLRELITEREYLVEVGIPCIRFYNRGQYRELHLTTDDWTACRVARNWSCLIDQILLQIPGLPLEHIILVDIDCHMPITPRIKYTTTPILTYLCIELSRPAI